MALSPKPLEVADFSGGITENFINGDPRRSYHLDNLFITADKQLEERFGIVGLSDDAYRIPGNTDRIGNLLTSENQTYLFAQANSRISVLSKTVPANTLYWNDVLGVNNSNRAMPGALSYSQVTSGEYQRQVYLTSDGDSLEGTQPVKIYQNSANVWVAKTSGLPRSYVSGAYTNSTLLSKCILLANDLRSSMIQHMQDAQYTSYNFIFPQLVNNYLHVNNDRYSLSYLIPITFSVGADPEIPSPLPTPAPAATDQTTLFTLVQALNLAYQHHMLDSMKSAYGNSNLSTPFYHQNMQTDPLAITINTFGMARGPGANVSNNSIPSTLTICATMLDDLVQKWYFHRNSVNTHSQNNNPGYLNRYPLTNSKIGTVAIGNTTPTVTPDYSDAINFANNLKFLYNTHIGAIGQSSAYYSHKQQNNANNELFGFTDYSVTLPDATSLDSAFNLIYWVRAQYQMHTRDASSPQSYVNIQFSTTSGSTSGTSVIRTDTGAAYTLGINSWVQISGGTFQSRTNAIGPTGNYVTARVLFSGSGTVTFDRPAASTGSVTGQETYSFYHNSNNKTILGTLLQTLSSPELSSSAMGNPYYTIGASTSSWLSLGEEVFNALSTHAENAAIHYGSSSLPIQIYQNMMNNVPYPEMQIPTIAEYIYAYFFSDKYTVGANGLQFLTQGNPLFSGVTDAAISWPVNYVKLDQSSFFVAPYAVLNTRSNVLTNLPVLTNTTATNYDLSNVNLNIYRSSDGGTVFYLLAQVPNGTLTYTDSVNDEISLPGQDPLITRQKMYTTGGIVGYDQPPKARFLHTYNGYTYYGWITDGIQIFPNRILQSVQYIQDAVPATFSIDLDDKLTGISSTKATLVAFCETSLFRISNSFNSVGQGSLNFERISDVVGCLNAKSIVQTEIGIFFAASDGFYYTDGYQIIKVSLELDKTYEKLISDKNQRRGITGTYDTLNRRIIWSLKENPNQAENSISYVLHLNMGTKPSAAFTTISNYPYYQPASTAFFKNEMYFGHSSGAVLKMSSSAKYDHVVDLNYAPTSWDKVYVPYDYTSTAVSLGSIFQRKWVTKTHIVGENIGNVLMQPLALRDLNQTQSGAKGMAIVNYAVNPRWGSPSCLWGSTTQKWEYDGKMDLWRRFPSTVLRSDFMQIVYKPQIGIVYDSSNPEWPSFANANVDSTLKTVSLITPTGYTNLVWPNDVVGMFISFATDNYVNQFQIASLQFQQLVTFSAVPTAGSFKLAYNGNSSALIAFNASVSTIQTTLRAVTGLSNVIVTGSFAAGLTVLFPTATSVPLSLTSNTNTLGVTISIALQKNTSTSNFLTFLDPSNLSLTASNIPWQISGYKKEQRFSLSAYVMHFAYLGDKNQKYPGAKTGDGPGNAGEN